MLNWKDRTQENYDKYILYVWSKFVWDPRTGFQHIQTMSSNALPFARSFLKHVDSRAYIETES